MLCFIISANCYMSFENREICRVPGGISVSQSRFHDTSLFSVMVMGARKWTISTT
jgi:hypothetical protein